MVRDLKGQVAENARQTRRTAASFVVAAERGRVALNFTDNEIELDAFIVIEERDISGQLISGAVDESNGSGRGVSGDRRGSWSETLDTLDSAEVTRSGRDAVRDILDGQTLNAETMVLGTDTTPATPDDTTLGDRTGARRTFPRPTTAAADEAEFRNGFRFNEVGTVSEVGLLDSDGNLLVRLTYSPLSTGDTTEVRPEITLVVDGDGEGDSVVLTQGEESIADALMNQGGGVGLSDIAFGSGTAQPSKGDSGLSTPEFSRPAGRELRSERFSLLTEVPRSEPGGQPLDITEVAVRDNTGTAVWVAPIQPQTKDEDTRLSTRVRFEFR